VTKQFKQIIGRRDKVDFPLLGVYNVDAKIDTGAYSSSIHCQNIEPFDNEGTLFVRFNLFDPSYPEYKEKIFELPVHELKRVRNPGGYSKERYFIKTSIALFNKTYKTIFSLVGRGDMKFPVLLGRRLLFNNFLVDVSQTNLSYKDKLMRNKDENNNSFKK
jgi:hypothetical protein